MDIEQVERLKLAVKYIEANPNEWDQNSWVGTLNAGTDIYRRLANGEFAVNIGCNTTMCLAGTVVHQAGYALTPFYAYDPETGEAVDSIPEVARELLGLEPEQANLLWTAGTKAAGTPDMYRGPNNPLTINEFKEIITGLTGVTFD